MMGISNVVALNKFVTEHEAANADEIANAINIKLRLADTKDNDARSHRLDAAIMLASLRKRVEDENQNWWKFATDHFDRSRRDIEKLLVLGNSKNPETAIATERETARAGMARSRDAAANVSRKPVPPILKILGLIAKLTDEERKELKAQLEQEEHFTW